MISTKLRYRIAAFSIGLALLGGGSSAALATEEGEKAASILKQLLADPVLRQEAIEQGKKDTFFCVNCHGDGGVSRYPDVPNLAGQNPVYVLNQSEAFLKGTRKDAFMEGLIRVLSERQKANMAVFYSSSPVKPARSTGKTALAQEGEKLYARYCARCHGPAARGDVEYPRLAGQQLDYLRINITRYLTSSGERIYPPMTAAVTQLGAKNIDAVVEYLSGLD